MFGQQTLGGRLPRRWLMKRLLVGSPRGRSRLANMSELPTRLTAPLRRDGLDPAALTGDDGASVRTIGRVLGMKVWMVTGYDEARAVLGDPHFSTDIRSLLGAAGHTDMIGGLGFTDPPVHTMLRKVLMPQFTARRLATLRPAVERIVDHQLDLMDGPTADLVADFASPVPFQVICELLGLTGADRDRLQRLGHDRFDVNHGAAGMFGALSESREFMREEVSRQRRAPGGGLIAAMIGTHGDVLDDSTLAGLADGVFTGGHQTSASMLALGVLALIQDPAALTAMQTDDTATDGIVDELLRYLSVVQIAFPRFAKRDMVLADQRVRAGDVVICSLSRANRSDVFGAAPGRFDPTRTAHPHLAFGHGFHRCIGAELARIQLRVAFDGIVRRFPEMTLVVPAGELQFHDLSVVHGLTALPVRLRDHSPAPQPHR